METINTDVAGVTFFFGKIMVAQMMTLNLRTSYDTEISLCLREKYYEKRIRIYHCNKGSFSTSDVKRNWGSANFLIILGTKIHED